MQKRYLRVDATSTFEGLAALVAMQVPDMGRACGRHQKQANWSIPFSVETAKPAGIFELLAPSPKFSPAPDRAHSSAAGCRRVVLLQILFCSVLPVSAQTGSVVTVNSENVLIINGRKVFPIGFSPGPPINSQTPVGDDAMQEFRDAGALLFRMVQNNNWDSQVMAQQQAALDWAAQHGMYIWLNLRELSEFNTGDTNTAASLKNLVDMYKSHPGLGLWKNFDEAWWGGVTVTQLLNGYNVIKQADTNHPVVQTHAPRGTLSDLQPYNVAADVLAVDIYPVANPPPTNPPLTNTNISVVGDWTRIIEQVAAGQKEHWTIEQIAFSGTTPPKNLVFPTFAQSRYMAYQAINNGARGLMFFGGNIAATLTDPTDAALQWNWTFWTNVLKSVVQELGDHGPLAQALVVSNSALPITITGTTVPDLEYVVREVPPYLYILATKREGTNATVTFNGIPGWAGTGEVLYESGRTVSPLSGHFSDSFAPFDVHVYRFAQSNVPPSILYQPQSRTNATGSSISLAVFADGTAPLSYQWRRSGTNLTYGGTLSGASSSALKLSNISAAINGPYDVVVTGFGSITSSVASVVASNVPPEVLLPPASVTNVSGSSASFNVVAIGGGTLSYQWRRDASNLTNSSSITGATSTSLTLTTISAADAGSYDVVVSGFGSVTSSPAILVVTNSPLPFYEPFDYPNVGSPVNSNSPGLWMFNGGAPNDLNVEAGSLSCPGLAASIGNSVTNGGVGYGTRRLFGLPVSSGALFFSALFRINNLGYGPSPTTNWNGGIAQVGALTATDNQSFRLQIMIKSNSPAGYVIGVQKGGTGVSASVDTMEYHAGDTVFLVGKYDFTVSPNSVSLWINPNPTNFGAASPPAGFLFATSGVDSNAFAIDRFNMRQNTPQSVPAAMQWDELRIATNWTGVTPPWMPVLANVKRLAGGSIQFNYTNTGSQTFTVYASTNLFNWSSIGIATQSSPGVFQFTDPATPNSSKRFYRLRSP
jgi:hypothetical protein